MEELVVNITGNETDIADLGNESGEMLADVEGMEEDITAELEDNSTDSTTVTAANISMIDFVDVEEVTDGENSTIVSTNDNLDELEDEDNVEEVLEEDSNVTSGNIGKSRDDTTTAENSSQVSENGESVAEESLTDDLAGNATGTNSTITIEPKEKESTESPKAPEDELPAVGNETLAIEEDDDKINVDDDDDAGDQLDGQLGAQLEEELEEELEELEEEKEQEEAEWELQQEEFDAKKTTRSPTLAPFASQEWSAQTQPTVSNGNQQLKGTKTSSESGNSNTPPILFIVLIVGSLLVFLFRGKFTKSSRAQGYRKLPHSSQNPYRNR